LTTNEAADCRWSLVDSDYSVMTNDFVCESDSIVDIPYACSGTLPVSENENKFYVRCVDQPWLAGSEDGERNMNQESYEYVLRKPSKELEIVSIKPDGDFEINKDWTSVELVVETSGGGEFVTCAYSLTEGARKIDMFTTTFANPHEQSLNLNKGRHAIFVECEDETGDKASGKTEFEIKYDDLPPAVARVFMSGSSLRIITTEESECAYSVDSCGFDFEDGFSMGSGKEHSISANRRSTYYVKCKDGHGRLPGSGACSIVVKPIDLMM